jgi:hypothetical protein
MGSDDDTIIIRKKITAALTAPASLKRWQVLALAVACFVAGALLL